MLGDKDGALADFTKAIDLEKRDVYYQWRGELYTEMGNAAAAQADQAEFERLQKKQEQQSNTDRILINNLSKAPQSNIAELFYFQKSFKLCIISRR